MRSSIVLLLALQYSQAQDGGWDDSYKLDYSYDPAAANGPDGWENVEGIGQWSQYDNPIIGQAGNQCGAATRPSPLHLEDTTGRCQDMHELLTRQIADTDCSRKDLTFDITPYSLRAGFPLTDDECVRPTVTASGRYAEFSLLWMELHARAEHVIQGKRYDAELQMVHTGQGIETGQMLTVSLMIEASSPHDDLEFEWLLQQWTAIAQEESDCSSRRQLRKQASDYQTSAGEEPRKLQFSPSPCQTDRFGKGCEPLAPRQRMYPYSLWPSIWYYGYTGSMTSPPCANSVQWRVLDEPLRISRRQYKMVTRLLTMSRDDSCNLDSAVNPNTGENFRPLQDRNEFYQFIYHCTPDDFGFFVYSEDEQ